MEFLTQILNFITGNGIGLADILGVLTALAAITPNKLDNAVLIFLRKLLDVGAFNFLYSENKTKPGESKIEGSTSA